MAYVKNPPWIDPKTGQRYSNPDLPIPGLGKAAWQATQDEYVNFLCFPNAEFTFEIRPYFYLSGWPEGISYVVGNETYARVTAHRNAVIQALRAKKDVPAEVLKDYPDALEYVKQYP